MDSDDIPEAIVASRQNQLVFLTGLDIVNNKSHAAVFSAFTVNREPDRPPINFVMLNNAQTFGELKVHQQTISNFSRGFIRVDWLKKYVNELPAVIVLFADLGWDHPSWNEKATECESKISSLRTSIGSNATRICIVLLQQTQTDSSLAVERSAKLCQVCQLPSKQLFVLPTGERMFSSVLRLESSFHELAQAFYQQCLKSVRARSIPNNFSNLIIRQQFKLAFLSELRQDTHTALRHYKLAYQHCTECEIVDSEIFELRSVAGLLNYKICQLSFLHSAALEALAQQRRHNTVFFCLPPGSYPSPSIASIEHMLWKGKQCSLFANLFERAVMGGLVAVSAQHPGMYLQASAYYYRQANEAIAVLNTSLTGLVYPNPDPLTSTTDVFYGQRPWRATVENGNLADPETEKNACIALELGCSPNHDRCISLLSSAMSQFKKYKCLRMQRYMMLLLSDEYFITGQYVKALQFASHLIWECRREGFIYPIAMLLLRALTCAFRVADVKEFMTLSVQILNLRTFPSFASITEQIAANIALIRQGFPPNVPTPHVNMSSAEVETCQHLWEMAFAERVFFSISAPRIGAFIRVRVAFLHNSVETAHADSLILLMVALSSYSSKAFLFEKMKITVSDGNKETEQLPLYEFTEDNVEVSPKKETVKMYRMLLPQSFCTTPKQLMVNGLSLEMGSIHSTVYGTIDWDAQSLSYGTYDNSYMNSILDACVGQTILQIEPREAHFRLEGIDQSEAMLGEIVTVPLTFICEESNPIESVKLDWCLDAKGEMVGAVIFINDENHFVPNDSKVLNYSNSQIPPFKVQLNIRYCTQTVCSANISVVVSIPLDDITVQKRFLISLRSRPPFDISSKILTINVRNDAVENLLVETNFFARADITTATDIIVSDISWKPGPEIEINEDETVLLKNEICCCKDDVISVCSPMRFSVKAENKRCDLGEVYIRWRRNNLMEGWVLSQLSIGSVFVKNSPLSIEAQPQISYLIVRTAIPVIFTIRNLCNKMIDLQITLEPVDMFVFAGNKKISFNITIGIAFPMISSIKRTLTLTRYPLEWFTLFYLTTRYFVDFIQ
uniref:Trafficking protein particle complex subunit 11 domain-containing protein n=1 Tax=Setaria digitata TaxID=48799 RepID=A0A915Q1U9_9BILA